MLKIEIQVKIFHGTYSAQTYILYMSCTLQNLCDTTMPLTSKLCVKYKPSLRLIQIFYIKSNSMARTIFEQLNIAEEWTTLISNTSTA